MIFRYQSGEEVAKGDRVTFHNEPGEIELVASPPGDPETDWYIKEHGGGIMIRELEPKLFGRVFISTDQLDKTEDLQFVARGGGK